MSLNIQNLLLYVKQNNFPDIHIKSWKKPYVRNRVWDLEKLDSFTFNWELVECIEFTQDDVSNIIEYIAWKEGLDKFNEEFELDTSYIVEDSIRFRINCYKDSFWNSIAMRLIPNDIPSCDQIWLWENIKKMLEANKGIILVTWPTWSWKSTNVAAMLDYINETQKKHIITIEDPIEFSFTDKNCLINQREIWNHTKWFNQAIKSSLREDPDVVLIWEMRDLETIRAALTLAETGHLVISTLHTNDTVQSIDRIIDVFPAVQQPQIRMQLSLSLVWIVSQRLLKRSDKEGRIPAREILLNNDAVKSLIIEWHTHQLYSVLEVSDKKGMVLMDKYLAALYRKSIISEKTMYSYARDVDIIKTLI